MKLPLKNIIEIITKLHSLITAAPPIIFISIVMKSSNLKKRHGMAHWKDNVLDITNAQ